MAYRALLNRKLKVFFTLSGEHPTLPVAELRSLVEAEEVEVEGLEARMPLVRLSADMEGCLRILDRASMVTGCCLELASSKEGLEDLVRKLGGIDWSMVDNKSFAVRVERREGASCNLRSMEIERIVGKVIKEGAKGARVNLESPEVLVKVLIVREGLYTGISLSRVGKARLFSERRLRKRPFFHPSALQPKLAKLFVNLARAREGDYILDPFAGTGSILIEAALIGCRPLYLDLDQDMVKGAKANFKHYIPHLAEVVRGDARKLPFLKVDCIATDPPYGRASSTKGEETSKLVRELLENAVELLPSERYACISTPSWVKLEEILPEGGFKKVEAHELRVHKSLTRVVSVLKRV